MVYILQHEIYNGLKTILSSEIVSVSLDFKKATEMFNAYVSALEEEWRKIEAAGKDNTFNRFSESLDNYVMGASLQRSYDECHGIYLLQYQPE